MKARARRTPAIMKRVLHDIREGIFSDGVHSAVHDALSRNISHFRYENTRHLTNENVIVATKNQISNRIRRQIMAKEIGNSRESKAISTVKRMARQGIVYKFRIFTDGAGSERPFSGYYAGWFYELDEALERIEAERAARYMATFRLDAFNAQANMVCSVKVGAAAKRKKS